MVKTTKFDCIIVGVGGQGSIFASRVLGEAAVREGYSRDLCRDARHGATRRDR